METANLSPSEYFHTLDMHNRPFYVCGGILNGLSEKEYNAHMEASDSLDQDTWYAINAGQNTFEWSKFLPRCASCGEMLGSEQTHKRTCSHACTLDMQAQGYKWSPLNGRWLSYWEV